MSDPVENKQTDTGTNRHTNTDADADADTDTDTHITASSRVIIVLGWSLFGLLLAIDLPWQVEKLNLVLLGTKQY